MASFVYTKRFTELLSGAINFTSDDIRAILVDSGTTLDTEPDIDTFAGATTVSEITATNYSSGGSALAGEAVNEDLPNDRAEFDATDLTWASLGGAVNDTIEAIVIYKWITNLNSSKPIAYLDSAAISSLPLTTNGGDVTFQWNAEGILQLANA